MVHSGEADAMLCGTVGRFKDHLKHIEGVIGIREGFREFSALTALILPNCRRDRGDDHSRRR
jgi:malate dehydrogenase (oxaloacetate-decarboxylating)(NADP+)